MQIKEMFLDFETVEFPVALCNVQNKRTPDVKDSAALFLCILVNARWPTQFRAEHLHPTVAVRRGVGVAGEPLYGWTDGDNWYDHQDHSLYEDDERVVAWKLIESGTPTTYDITWKAAE